VSWLLELADTHLEQRGDVGRELVLVLLNEALDGVGDLALPDTKDRRVGMVSTRASWLTEMCCALGACLRTA
jgi:hypothetical protein